MRDTRRTVILTFAIGLGLILAYVARHALLLLYVSTIFAVALRPAVDRIHRASLLGWHPGRAIALLLMIAAGAMAITALLLFAVPAVADDLGQMAGQIPSELQGLWQRLGNVPLIRRVDPGAIGGHVAGWLGSIAGVVTSAAGVVVSVGSVAILTAYLILDGDRAFRWAMSLFSPAVASRLDPTLRRAGVRMRGWISGQLMLMLILGSASAVVFGILGIRYFYLLAVIAGVANIIPLLGPILTVVLAGLAAAMDSWGKVLGVFIFYAIYQQAENAFLTPRIMKSQVPLSSTAVIVALLLGGEVAGVAGALVAVPSAVLVSVLLDEYVVQKHSR